MFLFFFFFLRLTLSISEKYQNIHLSFGITEVRAKSPGFGLGLLTHSRFGNRREKTEEKKSLVSVFVIHVIFGFLLWDRACKIPMTLSAKQGGIERVSQGSIW